MRSGNCEGELLRLLACMPFMDRLEMVAVSGRSMGAVYESAGRLEENGLIESVPHSNSLIAPTRRYGLTSAGLHALARREGMTVEELLRRFPVSESGRRLLMGRLDAAAVIYRLASALSDVAFPIRFRWYRAMPMDAAVTLPDGRTVALVRQGLTADRTAFSKRLWKLRELFRPSAILMVMADEVRLRHSRRAMSGGPSLTFFALEEDVVHAGASSSIWLPPSGPAVLDLARALAHTGVREPWPDEKLNRKAHLPGGMQAISSERWVPTWALPSLLKATEKNALDLLSDWPWLAPAHLGELLGVRRSRLFQVLGRLRHLGLLHDPPIEGIGRLALTNRGLTVLALRDRTSVGAARKRWNATLTNSGTPLDWRSVTGRRSRQLLRNLEHTESVHWFAATLKRQAYSRSVQLLQLDPPHRASRYFRFNGALRSIHPDAFFMMRKGDDKRPFFLEWERRAVRPATMADRLAPYLRYYSTHRPLDDHGARPTLLVVFDDELASIHFLNMAGEEMTRDGVTVPLLVSYKGLLERVGPLGRAWRETAGAEPAYAFS